MSNTKKTIFLGMPTRPENRAHVQAALALVHCSPSREHTIHLCGKHTSLLPHTFNKIWAEALTDRKRLGLTHFGMIHDDVCPPPGWLDIYLKEMDRVNADLLAAVIPIKGDEGTTSTGLDNPKNPWNTRRLTLTEVFARKPTFTHPRLLVNTGLWVCRLTELFTKPPLFFRQQDRLVEYGDDEWAAETIPEDWDFSRRVKERGGRIFATRIVPLFHEQERFHTNSPWGLWKTDEAYAEYLKGLKDGDQQATSEATDHWVDC